MLVLKCTAMCLLLIQDLTRNILKDTSVLMAATGTWYGVQAGMKALRGTEDAVNVCVAGTISAALLGATCKQHGGLYVCANTEVMIRLITP